MSAKIKKNTLPPNGKTLIKRGLTGFFSNNAFVLISFFVPLLAMLLCFAIRNFAPFGDQQILVVDLWHQYYPFLVDFQDKLVSGQSLLYSWSNGLGGNYLALMSYYTASPINFLTALVPAEYLIEFLMLSVCVDVGCAAGFMSIFLKKTFHRDGLPLVIFSAGYGCCAFFMGYYWNIIWLNTVAMLPLVALGMVMLWREKRFCLFTFSLALSVIANYYVGLFACIFVALGFIGYSIMYWNGIKDFVARLGRTALFSALALMLTAFMTIPAYYALGLTYSANNTFPSYWNMYYTWSELMSQTLDFVKPSTKENLPNIACGAAAIYFGIIYLSTKKILCRAKGFAVALLAFLTVSFNVNVLDYMWHGFHFTNMIPHRFAYLFSFVLLTIAFRAYTLIENAKIWDVLIGLFGSVMLIVISTTVKAGAPLWGTSIMIALLFTATLLYVYRIYPKIVLDLICFALVCAECIITCYIGITEVGSTGTSNYPEGEEKTADIIRAMNSFEENTTDMWRAEMTNTQTLNDASLNDYNGVSQFSSMSNVSVTKFLEEFGGQGWQGGNRYSYHESTPVMNTFLNVKYLISRNGTYGNSDYVSPVYQNGNEVLLKNNYYLPMGFVTDEALLDYTLEDRDGDVFSDLNPFDKENEFFSLATGVDEDVMEVIEPIGVNTSDGNNGYVTINRQFPDSIHGYDFTITPPADQMTTSVDFVYSIPKTGDYCVYCVYYNTSIDSKSITIKRDGNSVRTESDISRPYIVNAGQYTKGQQLAVAVEGMSPNKATSFVCYVARVNDEVFKKGFDVISKNTMKTTKLTDTKMEGEITSDTNGLLYTSIVHEDGWTVKVDGKEVKKEEVGGALLAFKIKKGTHKISMSYTPSGFAAGAFIALSGLFLLTAAAFLYRKYLSKTFIFKYNTHPNADPDRFDDNDDSIDINAFTECKTDRRYLTSDTPIMARVIFSIVFSVAYFRIWLAGIIKKIKTLAQQNPTYAVDVILSAVVPFYFVYAAYKYSKLTEAEAAKEKITVTSTFTHATLEFASSCGFMAAFITVLKTFASNFVTYHEEIKSNRAIVENGGQPSEHTVAIFPTGIALAVLIFCLVAGFAIRITNLYLFDIDIQRLAKRRFPSLRQQKKDSSKDPTE